MWKTAVSAIFSLPLQDNQMLTTAQLRGERPKMKIGQKNR